MNIQCWSYLWKYYFRRGKKWSFQYFCTRWLKYYIVLKLQITFNLILSAAKNTHPIKKALNKIYSELNFIRKICEHMRICLSPLRVELGMRKITWLKYYIVLKQQITFRCILVCKPVYLCVNPYTCVCKVPSNICRVKEVRRQTFARKLSGI